MSIIIFNKSRITVTYNLGMIKGEHPFKTVRSDAKIILFQGFLERER